MLTAGINAVECRQISHQYSYLVVDKHRCEDVHFCRRSKMIDTNDMLTAGINAVECRQISHQYSSLKQLISTGVKMYTFAGEAR